MACNSGKFPLSTPSSSLFVLGDRVVLKWSHSYGGHHGKIVGSKGRAFNGWTVLLDKGEYVGVGDDQMEKVDDE